MMLIGWGRGTRILHVDVQQSALIKVFFQHIPTDTGNGLSVFEATETGRVV